MSEAGIPTTRPRRCLPQVKTWMEWWGWTNGGAPGSVRLDAERRVIAHHGDSAWQADIERAVNGETTPSPISE